MNGVNGNGQECMDEDEKELSLLASRRLLFLQTQARLVPRHSSFRWPSSAHLFAIQDDLVKDLNLNHLDASTSKGDDAYTCVFLKELLSRLEIYLELHPNDENLEINEDLLESYALLKASSSITSSNPASRNVTHFFPSSSKSSDCSLLPGWQSIKMNEESTTISRGTTGLKTWEASLRLAGHLVAHPELLTSVKTNILEVGCGVGFLGIVAHKLCLENKIILTDLDGEVLENARRTIEMNCPNQLDFIQVRSLDWFDVQNGESEICHWLEEEVQPEIVLASDIVFDPGLIDPLCSTLAKMLKPKKNSIALISSTVRNPETFQQFIKTLKSFELTPNEVKLARQWIDLDTLEIVNDHDSFRETLLPLFPSSHDPSRDGHVKLICIKSS